MRLLILLAVLAGCNSSSVQYEMIEVYSEKLSNMRGSIQREKKDMLFQMLNRNTGKQRPRRRVPSLCRAIPRQTGALLATRGIDARRGATAERRAPEGNKKANESYGFSAGDKILPVKGWK